MMNMKIRIAGNTASPCYFAIKAKGYQVEIFSYLESEKENEWSFDYNATKDDLFFSATSPEELLGLISMWETRGDNWRANEKEADEYWDITCNIPMYDRDGNLIENK
ncbi:hypothetical protein EKN56_15840 [Limnobaculum zhutongyuii]|uniref:Uncharacterized protein n=1 Tax=Limnobaculum zhutongyuii TaxID=2498113 RepID=A0A411WNE3_9GAMM|nr:hypothetical protein [Limnobaculum zhutongyuii]QBH97744.1 hypothetical protein EKN56_15840 [Limnobaculum zhutongyuii]TQS87965.1 hypothetical protein ELQ32_13000 [Limnobaculum zhutongyuii]